MRFFGSPSRHRRRTSVISTIVTSRYIQGLLRRAEARAGDVYRAVRRGGKGFEKPSAQRGKGFEKLLTKGSIGFENRQKLIASADFVCLAAPTPECRPRCPWTY